MSERTTELKIRATVDKLNFSDLKSQINELSKMVATAKADIASKTGKSDSSIANMFLGSKDDIRKNMSALTQEYAAQIKISSDKQIEAARKAADALKVATTDNNNAKKTALLQEYTLSDKSIKTMTSGFNSNLKTELGTINQQLNDQISNIKRLAIEKEKAFNTDLKSFSSNSRLLNLSESQLRSNIRTVQQEKLRADWSRNSADLRRRQHQDELNAIKKQQAEQDAAQAKTVALGKANEIKNMTQSGIGSVIGGWFGPSALAAIAVQRSFEYEQAKARVRNVSSSPQETDMVMSKLGDTSRNTGQSATELATTYAKVRDSLKATGASVADTIALTDTLAYSLRASGTTADQASAAIYQLSQALGTGTLRGDEFNSVAEGAPEFTRALARSLGVTTGELRNMANTGGLTNSVILSVTSELNNLKLAASTVPLTPLQMFNKLLNDLGKSVAESNTGEMIRKLFSVLDGNTGLQSGLIDAAAATASIVLLGKITGALISAAGAYKKFKATATGIRIGSMLASSGAAIASGVAAAPVLATAGIVAGVGIGAAYGYSYLAGNSEKAKYEKQNKRVNEAQIAYDKELTAPIINDVNIAQARKNLESELTDLRFMENDAKKAAEIKKRIEDLDKTDVQSNKLGSFKRVESAFKLAEVKSLGGLSADKDYYAMANSFADSIKYLNKEVGMIGNVNTNLGLVEFEQILTKLAGTKSIDELAYGIQTLNKSLSDLGSDKAAMATQAIAQMTSSLETAIGKDLSTKVEYATKAISEYSKIVTTLGKSRLSSSLLDLSIEQNAKQTSEYKSGTSGFATEEYFARKKLNLEQKNEKDALALRLDGIQKERNAKLQTVKLTAEKQVQANADDLEKTRKILEQKSLANSFGNKAAANEMRASIRSQSELNRRLGSGENYVAEDTAYNAIQAIRENAARSVAIVERESNQSRLDAILDYKSKVESSITSMLQKQQDYARSVIDLERDIAKSRIDFERKSRDEQMALGKDYLKQRFLQEKAMNPKGTLVTPDYEMAGVFTQKQATDAALSKLRLSTTDYEKQQAIDLAKIEADRLKEMKLSANANGPLGDAGKIQQDINARKEYIDIINEIQRAEDALRVKQKDNAMAAEAMNNASLQDKVTEQMGLNAQVEALGGKEYGIASARLNSLNLDTSEQALSALRDKIQASLDSTDFKIRLNIDNSSKNSEGSMSPVNIYVGGEKIMEAKATQQQISSLNLRQAAAAAGR